MAQQKTVSGASGKPAATQPLSSRSGAKTRASTRAPAVIAETLIEAGTSGRVEIPVARLPTGAPSTMQIIAVHGVTDGPTIWLSSSIHGDELNGIAIIREVVGSIDPTKFRGTIIAVPMVNTYGVIAGSRYLPDRRDLNRSFPGSPRGSLAGRLAHLFMTHVVSRSDVGLDLHTGSAGRSNVPQIRCNLDDPETAKLARSFGAPVLLHAAERDGSLRAAAMSTGARVLLFEAGEAHRFSPSAIKAGVSGVTNVLANLGMLPTRKPRHVPRSREFRKSRWYRAVRSGFCEMLCDLGSTVTVGQNLAIIFDASGERERAVVAQEPGVVIGRLETAMVHRGDAVVHIAED